MITLVRKRNARRPIKLYIKQPSHYPTDAGTVPAPSGTVLRFIKRNGEYRLTSIRVNDGDGLSLQHHGDYQLNTEWHCVEITALMDALKTDRLYVGRNLCVVKPTFQTPPTQPDLSVG